MKNSWLGGRKSLQRKDEFSRCIEFDLLIITAHPSWFSHRCEQICWGNATSKLWGAGELYLHALGFAAYSRIDAMERGGKQFSQREEVGRQDPKRQMPGVLILFCLSLKRNSLLMKRFKRIRFISHLFIHSTTICRAPTVCQAFCELALWMWALEWNSAKSSSWEKPSVYPEMTMWWSGWGWAWGPPISWCLGEMTILSQSPQMPEETMAPHRGW